MIEATSELVWYQTQLGNGVHSAALDSTRDKGRNECGLRPHDLLEAALAFRKSELGSQGVCLTIQSRKLPTAQLRLTHAESPAGR